MSSNLIDGLDYIMTLPNEMFTSLRAARSFMLDLLDPSVYPKLPKQVRIAARARLKHFPNEHDINKLEEMFNNAHQDKNIIIGETNKQLQKVANEILIAQSTLSKLTGALQNFINHKENTNE
jgi:hypothetical protein